MACSLIPRYKLCMHRSWLTLLAFLSPLSFIGCHRASYTPDLLRTGGFRYRAGSAVVGAELDTLRVAVVAVNDSRQQRAIVVSSPCAPFNRVAASVRASAREWDSEIWHPPKQPPDHDSSGIPIFNGCSLMVLWISPGASKTFVLAVPVVEVLGDSLPRGRYRITARVRVNGQLVRGLDAGDVELSSPETGNRIRLDCPLVRSPSEYT